MVALKIIKLMGNKIVQNAKSGLSIRLIVSLIICGIMEEEGRMVKDVNS